MNYKRIREKIKENWLVCVLNFIVMIVGGLIGMYCACYLSDVSSDKNGTDTIYVEKIVTDSIMQNILMQIQEINNKVTPKKIYIRKHNPCDTLKIDASIRLKNDK